MIKCSLLNYIYLIKMKKNLPKKKIYNDGLKSNKQSQEIKEKEIKGQPLSLSKAELKILQKQQEKSLCKIHIGNNSGSGFLCLIPDPVLITNNHVLDKEKIKIGEKIKISFNDEEIFKNIIIDKNRKTYTIKKDENENEVDITIIEIRPKEDDLQNQEFIEYDEYLLNNDVKDRYEKKDIYIIHYKGGKCFSSTGIINEIINKNNTYDVNHTADTGFGSSGSPIILYNHKVIGVQRGFLKNEDCNKGTLLQFPINEYKKKINLINNNRKIKIILIINKILK